MHFLCQADGSSVGPQPRLHVWAPKGWYRLHRASARPLNVREEQSWSHSSQFFGFQLGLAFVVISVLVPIFAITNSSRYRAKSGQGILSQLHWDKPVLFAAYVYVKMFLARLTLPFSKAASSAALAAANADQVWHFRMRSQSQHGGGNIIMI